MPGQRCMNCKGFAVKDHGRIDPFHASPNTATEIVHPRSKPKHGPGLPDVPAPLESSRFPRTGKLQLLGHFPPAPHGPTTSRLVQNGHPACALPPPFLCSRQPRRMSLLQDTPQDAGPQPLHA
ncbi:hypothetical protein QBC45DRAFT_133981 [Copromyces sp. CBS 386.78]|nr:hypothetical protein QBC45DRAFT_133981 [Copromyces sp. CBS 386.78]